MHWEILGDPLDDNVSVVCTGVYISAKTLDKINKENRKVMVSGPRLLLILNILDKFPSLFSMLFSKYISIYHKWPTYFSHIIFLSVF